MENISDWFLRIIREDEKKGIMSGWIEEKRFIFLPSTSSKLTSCIFSIYPFG
jgi:hypothetical protein